MDDTPPPTPTPETNDRKPVKPAAKPAAKAEKRATLPLVFGLLAVIAIGALLYGLGKTYFSGEGPSQAALPPAIGGPFTLVDHNGATVTDADFRGKWMLIYFGYTFCPDICPATLTDMAEALDQLGEAGRDVVPILITVDPERDTPEHLKEYVTYFHPRTVGLTGTPEAVKAAAKAYKVYYAKSEIDPDDPGTYLVDHSSIIYLMGPDGRFRAHFSHGTRAETMAKRIREHL